ncbi:nucleotide exchange factor GrpE [bacterium]|nr:nucleotide exchange factor GrpE [bacterium]
MNQEREDERQNSPDDSEPEATEPDEESVSVEAGAETEPAAEPDVASLKQQLAVVKLELDEYKNYYLRKAAEFDNFKKRKQQEFLILVRTAEENLISELLPVLDDLERVEANESDDAPALMQGIGLIRGKMNSVLQSQGLEPIEAVGKPFDPELHEALLQQEQEGAEPDIVLQEHQRGYRLGDKVIRHAKVVVST